MGEHNYAVSFTRNTKPKIGAKIKIPHLPAGLPILVRATGPGAVQIPATAPAVAGDEITLPLTQSTGPVVNTIKYYNRKSGTKAFALKWEISLDAGTTWMEVATTKHTVYVTLNDPSTTLKQETLFELGCRNAAGETAESEARGKIYSEFTDRIVNRLDGKQMTYWLEAERGCIDTAELLSRADGNGNCQAWAGLFRDVLRVQGIQADRIRVWPKPNDTALFVKTWTFTEPPHGPSNHPYVVNLDATYNQPVPAQGNPSPPGSFNGHWITGSGATYYDPSYGTPPVSGPNRGKIYEDRAFDGFGARYQLPTNEVYDAVRKNNTSETSPAEVDYIEAN